MALQSSLWLAPIPPADVPTPAPGYYAFFISDGSDNTTAGALYKKDTAGALTAGLYNDQEARNAVGNILQNSDSVTLSYDGNVIVANVPDSAITTNKLADLSVTPEKLSTTYDAAGAAAAAQAASQPLNNQLTAISQLNTQPFGRNMLTVATSAVATAALDPATETTNGLMLAADKVRLDQIGQLGSLTSSIAGTGTRSLLTVQVPANSAPTGQSFRIHLFGYAVSAGTVTFHVYAGAFGSTADTACWTSITSSSLAANDRAGYDGALTVRTAGLSGTVQCECLGFAHTALLPSATNAPATNAVNTTANWYITLGVTSTGSFAGLQALVATQ